MKSVIFTREELSTYIEGRGKMFVFPLKPQPPEGYTYNEGDGVEHFWYEHNYDSDDGAHWPSYEKGMALPYEVGDTLFVKEKWRVAAWKYEDDENFVAFDHSCAPYDTSWHKCPADDLYDVLVDESVEDCRKVGILPDFQGNISFEKFHSPCRWRTAEDMPEWVARFRIKVISVELKRIDEMTHNECDVCGLDFYELYENNIWVVLVRYECVE